MFIDIHGHTFRGKPIVQLAPGHAFMTEPADLVAVYDCIGIERAVLIPLVNPENTPGIYQSNEEILQISQDFPGRFLPFCNVDPRSQHSSWRSPLTAILSCYREAGFLGIGEVCANLPFLDPRVQNLFGAAEAVGIPLTFHLSPKPRRIPLATTSRCVGRRWRSSAWESSSASRIICFDFRSGTTRPCSRPIFFIADSAG